MPNAAEPKKFDPLQIHAAGEHKYARPLVTCRFDPTGRFLFSGAEDNLLQRWDLADGKRTAFAGHDSWVHAIAFAPDGKRVFSGGYDGKLIWWPAEAADPKPERILEAHAGWVRAAAVSPNGEFLASCGNDHLVKVFAIADGKLKWEFPGHTRHVYNLAFHPDGKSLASTDLLGIVKQWDMESGKHIRDLDAKALWKYDSGFWADIGGARGMAFDPTGARLACSGITDVTNAFAGVGKPLVVLIDWKDGKGSLLRPKEDFQGVAWGLALHPAGIVIAVGSGGAGGALWFWSTADGKPVHAFKLPAGGRDMALHPDGLRVAVAHTDSILRIYEMAAAVKA